MFYKTHIYIQLGIVISSSRYYKSIYLYITVYHAFLLIVVAFKFIACECPLEDIVQIGNCSFRIHCYGELQNISPSNCRGSINGQKAIELTLTQTTDKFDKNIDPEFLNSITSLTASGNWPKTNLTFLNHMTQLRKLVLTRNYIQTIDRSMPFYLLENLEYLDLSYNKFTDIDELFIFETMPNNVTFISVAYNDITELSDGVFDDLTSLRELDLSHNRISELSAEVFNNLTMLETLNLNNNTITSLNGFLDNLDSLVHLFLRGNRLKSIDIRSVSRIQQLKTFDISGNHLYIITPTVLLRHWKSIDGVCKIRLAENRVTTLLNGTKDTLWRYTRDINKHNIKQKTELDLSRNLLTNVAYNAFLYVLRLVSLDLSYNQLREFVVNNTNMAQVRILNLSNNRIAYFIPHTFNNMRSLEILDISNNNFRHKSHYPLFAHTYNLIYLNMANNKLERLINLDVMMKGNYGNNVLDLSNTELSEFHLSDRESSSITVLILNSNKIFEAFFINLVSHKGLRRLEVNRNQIEKLNATSLRLPMNLISLSLSENKIKEIGPSTFLYVRHLKTLNLTNNQLETIQYGAFQGLTSLTNLDLSNNRIKYLDSKLLIDLKTLDVLYLKSNGLTNLDYKGWLGHTYLLKVYLEGNNYSCIWLGKAIADFNNGYSKMKPTVERMSSGPSIEGVPCIPQSTELEELNEVSKSVPVMVDERLLVINQKILETLREQTFYLREFYQQYHLPVKGLMGPFHPLRNVRRPK